MAYPETVFTQLVIDLIAIPNAAAYNIKQSYQHIAAATALRRTVNAVLVDISLPAFRKYKSTISGGWMLPPALDGIRPGQQVVVSCLAELSYLTSGGSPAKTVVSGSSRTDGAFTYYRPQMTMRVVGIQQSTEEWAASVSWSIELEEV